MSGWYDIKAFGQKAEIRIHGEIGKDVNFSQFLTELQALGPTMDLRIRVASGGGNVFEGIAVANAISAHQGKTTGYVEAYAGSIATVILAACDRVEMPANAMQFIHEPWVETRGSARAHAEAIEALHKLEQVMVAAYVARTGLGEADVRAIMAADTLLTAEEAKAKGFADEIVDPVAIMAMAGIEKFTPAAALAALPVALRGATVPTTTKEPAMSGSTIPAEGQQASVTPAPAPTVATFDPAAVARACLDGGFPEMTAALIEARADLAAVAARIEAAKQIGDICARARIPDQAKALIASGATPDAARAVAFEVMVARDAATQVSGTQPAASQAQAADAGWGGIVARTFKK